MFPFHTDIMPHDICACRSRCRARAFTYETCVCTTASKILGAVVHCSPVPSSVNLCSCERPWIVRGMPLLGFTPSGGYLDALQPSGLRQRKDCRNGCPRRPPFPPPRQRSPRGSRRTGMTRARRRRSRSSRLRTPGSTRRTCRTATQHGGTQTRHGPPPTQVPLVLHRGCPLGPPHHPSALLACVIESHASMCWDSHWCRSM